MFADESTEAEITSQLPPPWTWRETLSAIPLSLIIICTILGNGLVLFVFITRSRFLRSPTHFFIANLAFCDFFVGVLVMPFLASLFLNRTWSFGSPFCLAWTMIHFTLCGSSILSTCSVCIERYIGVRWPLNHKEILSRPRIYMGILGVWTTSLFLMVTSLFLFPENINDDPNACKVNRRIGHILIAVVGTLYIPGAIMVVLYVKIYQIASTHMNNMRKTSSPSKSQAHTTSSGVISSHESSSGFKSSANESSVSRDFESNDSTTAMLKKENSSRNSEAVKDLALEASTKKQINLAMRLTVLVGIMMLSYGPPFTLNMYMAIRPGTVSDRTFLTLAWMRYFNSCINPVIYAFAVPAYRKAMISVLRKFLPKFSTPERTGTVKG